MALSVQKLRNRLCCVTQGYALPQEGIAFLVYGDAKRTIRTYALGIKGSLIGHGIDERLLLGGPPPILTTAEDVGHHLEAFPDRHLLLPVGLAMDMWDLSAAEFAKE